MARRVTLQTLAEHLGVSRTTVSNAYNRPEQLSDELRRRILAAAEELGYRGPDAAARMLRTGRHDTIGVVFTEDLRFVFSDPDTTTFLEGVAEASTGAGTGVLLLPSPAGMPVAQTPLARAAVDGFLVFSAPDDHPAVQEVIARRLPTVLVDEPDLGADASFLGIDDRGGASLLGRHLHEFGHRRIGMVTLPMSADRAAGPARRSADEARTSSVRVVRARTAGIIDAGLEPVVFEARANDPDAGREAALELLRTVSDVTAVVALSDQLAIGAIQAAFRLGLDVPHDLSVVGFDDIPRASTWDIPLTTIRQPLVDKGRRAARLLQDLIEADEPAPVRETLPIELVVRASSGPAADR
ncbi:MAG: LacI family DNA-binding transcriptional regulator [Actinomycetota bacterium]